MRVLLHICCANCAIYPVARLRENHHQVEGFFLNPNIQPFLEFQRRLAAVRDYALQVELPVIVDADYALETFLANVAADPANRCAYCYRSRLEETARTAQAQGYAAFSTTLLYSRYQQHVMIRAVGEELASRYGVGFYYEDFRLGWNAGIRQSKEMGLYRQQYCGCIYSEKDRYWRPNAT